MVSIYVKGKFWGDAKDYVHALCIARFLSAIGYQDVVIA